MTRRFSFRQHPVLGTELHVIVVGQAGDSAQQAHHRVLGEISRLESLLSTYRDDSALAHWMHGAVDDEHVPKEVVDVLAVAQEWFAASRGALNPDLGRLRARWRQAERDGRAPSRDECAGLAAQSAALPYWVEVDAGGRRVRRLRDCSGLDLDAVAKGWIVDRAAEAAIGAGVESAMVNCGGDLRIVGSGSVRVAIEDPRSVLDNADPLAVAEVGSGGLASSGGARRGFAVAGEWFGHVLDPRSGWPVDATAGATVIAADTATADALATVVGVEGLSGPTASALLAVTESAALVVDGDGGVRASPLWADRTAAAVGRSTD